MTIAAFGVFKIKFAVLALSLIWLSVTDLEDQIIPDLAVLAVATWGVATRDPILSGELLVDLCAATAVLAVLWGIGEIYWHKKGQEALGFGDAKLLAASVLCVGWANTMWVIVIAALGGIALILLGKLFSAQNQHGISFGPFIGYALFMTVNIVGGL